MLKLKDINYGKLELTKQPVALIDSINNCHEASLASADEVQGLLPWLRQCKGAIILRKKSSGI